MPSSFGLPPVECCCGTSPSHVANSRPLLKAAPLPIAATIAVLEKESWPTSRPKAQLRPLLSALRLSWRLSALRSMQLTQANSQLNSQALAAARDAALLDKEQLKYMRSAKP